MNDEHKALLLQVKPLLDLAAAGGFRDHVYSPALGGFVIPQPIVRTIVFDRFARWTADDDAEYERFELPLSPGVTFLGSRGRDGKIVVRAKAGSGPAGRVGSA